MKVSSSVSLLSGLALLLGCQNVSGDENMTTTEMTTTESADVYCTDSYQCEGLTLDDENIYCYGYYACDDATIGTTYHYNYGALASYDANISAVASLSYGYRAAYYADLDVQNLYAFGFQSLLYADIRPFDDQLTIQFSGYYSGYDADVLCYDGQSCTIYCGRDHGCYDLKFYCYSGATCYYNCDADAVCPTLYSGVITSMKTSTLNSKIQSHTHYSGLSDDEITMKYNENQLKKQMKIKKELETGEMDQDLYQRTIALAKSRGELDALPKEFFEPFKAPHQEDGLFDQIKYSGNDAIIYGSLGALLMGLVGVIGYFALIKNGKESGYQTIA